MPTETLAPGRRAQFLALRRAIFAEVAPGSIRPRLVAAIAVHGALLVAFVARGFPSARLVVQGVLWAYSVFAYAAATRGIHAGGGAYDRRWRLRTGAAISYAVCLANTGALASPLLPAGFGWLVAAALGPEAPKQRRAFVGVSLGIVAALALLSLTDLGRLPASLAFRDDHLSADWIALATASAVLAVLDLQDLMRRVKDAYERVALEVASRREELCSETEDRTRALEGIAARLAHEIKNPLAAIKGLSWQVARQASDAKTAERLGTIAAEADRLAAIVDGFVSFSRGLDELKLAPTRPAELAGELILLLETRSSEAGVTLRSEGESAIEIVADERKIRQALLNVVLNAMQASARGQTVTIEVEPADAGDDGAVVRVVDRGTGMTSEVLQRIQKPYFTTREGGTGLGLAIARGLVEQHGGRLEIESAPGVGTTVTMRLPRTARSAPDALVAIPRVPYSKAEARHACRAEARSKRGGEGE
jgi:signal transduction histidine kinase